MSTDGLICKNERSFAVAAAAEKPRDALHRLLLWIAIHTWLDNIFVTRSIARPLSDCWGYCHQWHSCSLFKACIL